MSVVMVYLYGRDQFCGHLIWHQECLQYQISQDCQKSTSTLFVIEQGIGLQVFQTATGVLDLIDFVDD